MAVACTDEGGGDDAGPPDAGAPDASSVDAGLQDASVRDVGSRDVGSADARPAFDATGVDAPTSADAGDGGGACPSVTCPKVVRVEAGRGETCALREDGSLWCWGAGELGQLGDGMMQSRSTPLAVPGLADVQSFSVSPGSACAVVGDGTVWCWGVGPDTMPVPSPTLIDGLADVVEVETMGDYYPAIDFIPSFVAVRTADGTVMDVPWYDLSAQLSTEPRTVPGLRATDLTAGARHFCALDTEGLLWCWGDATLDVLNPVVIGPGMTLDAFIPYPVVIDLPQPSTAIAAGGAQQCTFDAEGRRCWGIVLDNWSQPDDPFRSMALTVATSPVDQAEPIPLSSPAQVDEGRIAIGALHTCEITEASTVRCFERNDWGQLGDGTFDSSSVGTDVTGLTGVTQIAAGHWHTCAVSDVGDLHCWGRNDSGQLGDGTTSDQNVPVLVEF